LVDHQAHPGPVGSPELLRLAGGLVLQLVQARVERDGFQLGLITVAIRVGGDQARVVTEAHALPAHLTEREHHLGALVNSLGAAVSLPHACGKREDRQKNRKGTHAHETEGTPDLFNGQVY
jgi:hypothetical protein